MTIDKFVQILPGAKQNRRGGWRALCPAHSDKNPSLSVTEGRGGCILLRCFAGCTVSEVTSALGIKLSDLFPESRKCSAEIRRQREQRGRARAIEDIERQCHGLMTDAFREADYFVRSRKGVAISDWSDQELDEEMQAIALAYAILAEEERRDV